MDVAWDQEDLGYLDKRRRAACSVFEMVWRLSLTTKLSRPAQVLSQRSTLGNSMGSVDAHAEKRQGAIAQSLRLPCPHMRQTTSVLGRACDMLAPCRFWADFMQAVGAARPARNLHAAQKAIGDVLLQYTSQAWCCLFGHARVLAVHCMSRSVLEACARSATAIFASTALVTFWQCPLSFCGG